MLKLKNEYKTAVIGGYDGRLTIELLFVPETEYPRIAKDFPHFFEEVFDGMAKTQLTSKITKDDISKS